MINPSTAAGFTGRRRPNNVGWVVIGGGWLLLVLAIVFLMIRKDGSALYGLVAAVGAVCIAVGGFLAAGGRAFWAIPGALFSGFLLFFGFLIASGALKTEARGEPVTCQVTGVRPETYTRTTTDSQGRRRTVTDTRYWHTMTCPTGTFNVSSSSPRPVNTQIQMVQVPGEQPRFAGSGGSAIGLGMGSVGGLIALVVTIGAWVQSRRWTAGVENAQFIPPMPAYPYSGNPQSAGPYPPGPGAYPPGSSVGSPSGPISPPPLPGQPGRLPGQQEQGRGTGSSAAPYEQW